MNNLNLRQNFATSALRSGFAVIVLLLLLAVTPQVDMLQNQKFSINNSSVTGVEVAKVLISLIIVGILMHLAYLSETQLPKLGIQVPQLGLIIASTIHITIIFIVYFYLLPFATDRFGNVNQVFNAIFLFVLLVPLARGGKALYDAFNRLISAPRPTTIRCNNCGHENGKTSKHCQNCGETLTFFGSQQTACKNCGEQNNADMKYCGNCGYALQESVTQPKFIICPQCETKNKEGVKFCTECGTALTNS